VSRPVLLVGGTIRATAGHRGTVPATHAFERQVEVEPISGSRSPVDNGFSVETRQRDRATVVSVSGELDLVTTPMLEAELERAGGARAQRLILDLRRVSFMDSTGLSLLVKAQHRADATPRQLAVVKGTEQVLRLLKLTGVADRLTLIDTPEQSPWPDP
jgi:anti-sigma B factor antagonist